MLFGKRKKSGGAGRIETLVGRNTTITGDLSFTGGLHIEGEVIGDVLAGDDSSILVLSEEGLVRGDIHVPNMVLNGRVEGDVYASEHCELAPRARITGNVYYHLIEMSMGATVNGNLIHQEGGKPRLEFEGSEEAGAEAVQENEAPAAGDDAPEGVAEDAPRSETAARATSSRARKTAAGAGDS
ncbi:MAG: polymer-forming cytoskeletal protein [Gammaproteobacteria bacterium]|nr:MAG: polymer-forming cytoskeletal protein [Gammaproteobacteria bacterium]